MNRPGTFDRVYAAIKQQLRCGLFRPGDRLEPAVLSYELNASVTPVRDALHRLTGERLVEAPRHEGFRVPMITEAALRHLYGWHRNLLLLALVNNRAMPSPSELIGGEYSGAPGIVRRIFLTLAQRAGNPEHLAALESVAERLQPIERLEPVVLQGIEEEKTEFEVALEVGNVKALRRAIVRYHRRRIRYVPELLEHLLKD